MILPLFSIIYYGHDLTLGCTTLCLFRHRDRIVCAHHSADRSACLRMHTTTSRQTSASHSRYLILRNCRPPATSASVHHRIPSWLESAAAVVTAQSSKAQAVSACKRVHVGVNGGYNESPNLDSAAGTSYYSHVPCQCFHSFQSLPILAYLP